MNKNVLILFFDSQMRFSSKISGERSSLKGSIKYERCIIKANTEEQGVVINTMIVYHFYDSDLGVDIFFEKQGATK